jgi:hypothetical protein
MFYDPVKVVNMKASPNVLIYLLQKFHIFWSPLANSLDLIFKSVIIEKG